MHAQRQAASLLWPSNVDKTSLLLPGWSAICLAIPLWFHAQPSPEPTIARAVVIVFLEGPAAILALIGNAVSLVERRTLPGMLLTALMAAIILIWLAVVLAA